MENNFSVKDIINSFSSIDAIYNNSLDIKKYGIIPELLGRLPIVVALLPLDREALKRILLEPKNSLISQYKKLFSYDGKNISR